MRRFVLISFAVVLSFAVLVTLVCVSTNMRSIKTSKAKVKVDAATAASKSARAIRCKNQQRNRIYWNYFYYYENEENNKSLLWCKIPKSGSTTVTRLLLNLAGAHDILQKNTTKIHRTLRKYYPRPTLKNSKQQLDASYKFIVVRHPFERILSAYRDKLENYQRDLIFRDGYYYDRYGKFMKVSNSTQKEPSWQEFVSYLIQTPVARFDQHWMPMTRLCSPCKIHYDAIIKLERLTPEISRLLRKIGISISPSKIGPAHRTGSSRADTISKYFEQLTLTDIKLLYQKYKTDFVSFGYSPLKYYKMAKNI